jgi:hypothetical protein
VGKPKKDQSGVRGGARIELALYCTLTDEEVQSRGLMLGETISAIDDTNGARTAAMKEFKDRLTGFVELQRKLARIIRERSEERMVTCWVIYHAPAEGMKRIVRSDTGEVVREEEMTSSEKQLNLFASQQDFQQFMDCQGIPEPPEDDAPHDESGPKVQ